MIENDDSDNDKNFLVNPEELLNQNQEKKDNEPSRCPHCGKLSNEKIEETTYSKESFCKCCCEKCSEDIIYGITFIGRLIMTFYSLQALFFLYNFMINFIFLIPGMLFFTDNILLKISTIIVYVFFASLSSNILIIPTYEFLLFPFLRSKNVMAHLESLRIAINIIHNNNRAKDTIKFKKVNLS